MNKRELVLDLLASSRNYDKTPAGFFIHFGSEYQRGQAAINRHLEYFHYTGMDFVKIQYEHVFPRLKEIKKPEDWVKIPLYKREFFEEPLAVVKGLVDAAKKEALVIQTLYSPFMCAGHAVGDQALMEHIHLDPVNIQKGMEVITESVMIFAKECIKLGVDGFYASTQGGETDRFRDPSLFNECVKPYDLAIMNEINRQCVFNVLHICDYHYGYHDLKPFLDYPGQVVNCSLQLGNRKMSGKEVENLFHRPFMGGMERKGIIVNGNPKQIRTAVEGAIKDAPNRYILAADCTLPNDIPWENIRLAIATTHDYQRGK